MMKMLKERFGTCSKDCYGSCVFTGEWNDQAPETKFMGAQPTINHPFTNGFFCAKFTNREKLIYHSDRIKTALIRTGSKGNNSFKPAPLEKALDLIADKLQQVKDDYKPSSIVAAYYAGNNGLISMYSPFRFFGKLGNIITSEGICNEAGCSALENLFGTYSTTNPSQIISPNNRLIVVWGCNLSERNNHAYFLVKKAIKNGSLVVVVNPIRTKLAGKAQLFIQSFPGTDYLIAKFVLNQIITSGEHDNDFINHHVDNLNELSVDLKKVNEDEIISQVGVDRDVLQEFTDLLLKYKHQTLFIVGFGPQKYIYGGKNLNSIALIQIVLGNFGKPGTGLLYSQSAFNKKLRDPLIEYISQSIMYPQNETTPLVTLGSFLSSNDCKMLIVYNCNLASSLPNQNAIKKALSREDLYVVVLDMFLNETTKFADVVIPVKFDLECDDLTTSYFMPGISVNQGGPCPYSDCLSNYEFFQLLAKRIGWQNDSIFQESQKEIFDRCVDLLPREIRENLRDKGYHIPFSVNEIPFDDLQFPTHNGKIQVNPSYFALTDLKLDLQMPRNRNEFYLLSPSHKYFIHSQFSEIHGIYENEFDKVYLNPIDIKSLELKPNQEVLGIPYMI
jgi:anaerobic selenocysteine-containing dehydrogenase